MSDEKKLVDGGPASPSMRAGIYGVGHDSKVGGFAELTVNGVTYSSLVVVERLVGWTALMEDRDSWKRTAEMYITAWTREVAEFDGTIRRKSHHIDALVLTTQELVRKAREGVRGLPSEVSEWVEAERARWLCEEAMHVRERACELADVAVEVSLERHALAKASEREGEARRGMIRALGAWKADGGVGVVSRGKTAVPPLPTVEEHG
jgi:hypothetical protein